MAVDENVPYAIIRLLTRHCGEIVGHLAATRDFLAVAATESDVVEERSGLLPEDRFALSEEIALAATIGSYPVPVEGDAFPTVEALCGQTTPLARYAEIVTAGKRAEGGSVSDLLRAARREDLRRRQA